MGGRSERPINGKALAFLQLKHPRCSWSLPQGRRGVCKVGLVVFLCLGPPMRYHFARQTTKLVIQIHLKTRQINVVGNLSTRVTCLWGLRQAIPTTNVATEIVETGLQVKMPSYRAGANQALNLMSQVDLC